MASLSESARASFLASGEHSTALKNVIKAVADYRRAGPLDGGMGAMAHALTLYTGEILDRYSAHLARTPLTDVTCNPEHVKLWLAHPWNLQQEEKNIRALANDFLKLFNLAASLQERIAALIDENTKLKCELDGAMDGAACDLETIRHKTAEVAALTAERAKLDKECNEWMRQSVLLRAENEALTARAENATASPFIFQSLPLRVRDKMCSVVAEKLAAGGGLPTSHSERWYLAAALLDVAMPLPARTPPVPEDTKNE